MNKFKDLLDDIIILIKRQFNPLWFLVETSNEEKKTPKMEKLFFKRVLKPWKGNDWFEAFILKSLKTQREEIKKIIREIETRKFPRGERKWCIECVKKY